MEMSSAKRRLDNIAGHLSLDGPPQTQQHASNNATTAGKPKLELEKHAVDAARSLKVAVIGAGISGILAGVLLPIKVPGIELTIFEKNADVSGTWLENTYPGVRCDVPANVYQSSFSPNTQWSEEFAQGKEIRAYWQGLATKYKVYELVRFKKKVKRAEWNRQEKQWVLDVHDTERDTELQHRFDFVITAIGHFNAFKLPDYPGIDTYQGHLRHSSNWDPNFSPTGKNVAVIGNGASGVQIVPELQKVVKRLDHYARSKTWIAGSLGGRDRQAEPMYFSKEQLKSFEDPETYLKYRKELENTYWHRFGAIIKDSKENVDAKQEFTLLMERRLTEKPELLQKLIPDFSPHCRRLTPGPGYLEAIASDNVDYIQTRISRITETGIETIDGVHRPVDAIICSTGANVDFSPPFPIVSGDVDLSVSWKPDGLHGFPYSYLGLATPGFPNLLFIHGPNAAGQSGTLPHSVETQITYIAKLLRKVSRQGIQTIVPSKAAADDFVEFIDTFFPSTVLSEDCSSWSNGGISGGRIHGHWPGSAAHVTFVRREPRWEDFEYELRPSNKSRNRFAYFGDGWTTKERDPDSDLTPYLKLPETDLRDLHESWWDL